MNRPILEQFQDVFDNLSLSLFENNLDDYHNTVYMHYHDRLEIIHVLDGEGIVSVNLKEYSITAGDIILIAPNEIHSVKGKGDILLHCQTVVFQADSFGLQGEYNLKTLIKKEMPGNQDFRAILSFIFHIRDTGLSHAKSVIHGQLLSLCGLITYHNYYFAFSNKISSTVALKEVIKYMQENYTHKIEVEALAETAGYSKYHFIRFFSNATGYTCVQYLHMLRLQKARELLLHTTYNIEQVSLLCGFESASFFIRIFKREEKITPLQFRKQHINGHYHEISTTI